MLSDEINMSLKSVLTDCLVEPSSLAPLVVADGDDDDGGAELEYDSAKRISSMSGRGRFFRDTVCTDEVRVEFNFRASFHACKFLVIRV